MLGNAKAAKAVTANPVFVPLGAYGTKGAQAATTTAEAIGMAFKAAAHARSNLPFGKVGDFELAVAVRLLSAELEIRAPGSGQLRLAHMDLRNNCVLVPRTAVHYASSKRYS